MQRLREHRPQPPRKQGDSMFKSMGGSQGPPHLHSGGGVWGKPDSRPTLARFQMKSKDISVEEWKGSETYSPNTAYGKTPALTPASR